MINENEIKQNIADVLYEKDIINEELYAKCSKPTYIRDLPGSLRSTDEKELRDRLSSLNDLINEQVEEAKELDKEINDNELNIESIKKDINETTDNIEEIIDDIYNMVDDDMNGDRDYFKNNTVPQEDEFGDAYDDYLDNETVKYYHQFYDNLMNSRKEIKKFKENLNDENIKYNIKLDKAIENMTNALVNGELSSNLYLEDWVENNISELSNELSNLFENIESINNSFDKRKELKKNKIKHHRKTTIINDEQQLTVERLESLGYMV